MAEVEVGSNFVREIVEEDLKNGKNGGRVATRFPPEPNGYLHIGHAKSICLNFGLAKQFGGTCNLRFDDTDPVKEDTEYCDSIKEDVRWLGFDWNALYFASDYFDQLYAWAQELIRRGKAYVCELTPEQIREYRGNFYTPGKESPWRNRPAEESLDLLERMKRGEFKEGERVLRAKIDMNHKNMNMRDPLIYRIKHVSHHRTGDKWCIYPMYDFAHGLSDAIEGITHSVCTLEFEDHRILYDWFIEALELDKHPQQIEFAKLNLTYTVMSKRRLLSLVKDGVVMGWNDPRMPTISGMRRRGFPPEAIRAFCERIGVNKRDSMVDVALLEHCVRERLNDIAPRIMGVPKIKSSGSMRLIIRPMNRLDRANCRLAVNFGSTVPISWKMRRRSFSASRRGAKCACVMPISSSARASTKTKTGTLSKCVVRMIPRVLAANRPMVAKSK